MIVPEMNSKEILIEIFKDIVIVNRKATYLTQSLRREAVKSKYKFVQRVFDYKSSRNNDWFIIADHYVKQPSFTVVAYYLDKYGFNGMLVHGDNNSLIHFTAHFLDRYNERFLKQMNPTKLELLKLFVPANPLQIIKTVSEYEEGDNRIFGRLSEGIGLGYMEKFYDQRKIVHHFKTFISDDMIIERQLDIFNLTNNAYDKYWNEMNNNLPLCA